jgi:hypothetical protein
MNVKVVNGLDERVELQIPAQPPRGMKILAHALAEIARLPDVDDRAETILHKVHARPVRKLAEFVPDVFGRRHGVNVPNDITF